MDKNILTTKQAKFLQRVRLEFPFNQIDWTISNVLEKGTYSEVEKKKINDTIKKWKDHRKKFD